MGFCFRSAPFMAGGSLYYSEVFSSEAGGEKEYLARLFRMIADADGSRACSDYHAYLI